MTGIEITEVGKAHREPRTVRTVKRGEGKARVYCAGPMFSPAEKWEAVQIAQELDLKGYEVFLPQEDGIELKKLMEQITKHPELFARVIMFNPALRQAVFALDFYLVLDWCQALVFNMNGRVPDEGGVVEVTGAYVAGKAIVLYKETPISFISGDDNPMIDGLEENFYNVSTVEDIPREVETALRELAPWTGSLPPQTKEPLELGKKIWAIRQALEPTEDKKGWTGDLQKMIETFPIFIELDLGIQVNDEGRIFFPAVEGVVHEEIEIGFLPSGLPGENRGYVHDLWKEFSDRVYATMHGRGHNDTRNRKIKRAVVEGCAACKEFEKLHP